MKLYHTPKWLQWLYPAYTWRRPAGEGCIYLTFDDGPTPALGNWILETLQEADTRATFFFVGDNVRRHPELAKLFTEKGHVAANHTCNHRNGWRTDSDSYIENVHAAAGLIDSRLFRPPYGKIKKKQAKALMRQGFEIVMWSVLTYDFDPKLDKEKAWQKLKPLIRPGEIIVFHDNIKAEENLRYLLPLTLAEIKRKGLRSSTL